jgi:hypothetical protein
MFEAPPERAAAAASRVLAAVALAAVREAVGGVRHPHCPGRLEWSGMDIVALLMTYVIDVAV